MAEINIEPRRRGFNWLWLLGIAALLGLLVFLFVGKGDRNVSQTADNTSNAMEKGVGAASGAAGGMADRASSAWNGLDFNAPRVDRDELKISSPDFETRGNDNYTIYSLGENLLFDSDKAELSNKAQQNLNQIVASIKKRYADGQIRVYGYTDARANDQHNKELSAERAEAVKKWLTSKGNLSESQVSVHPMGEENPVASNQTSGGQKMNRRVEIVAMNSKE